MTVAELERNQTGDGAKSRYRIVDADQHVDPPHTFRQEYLPAHLHELVPTIEEGDEHDWVVFEGVEMRHMPGGKNIMWSSDFPHSESTYPHSREFIAQEFEGIPGADMREIVGGIAGRLFQFD